MISVRFITKRIEWFHNQKDRMINQVTVIRFPPLYIRPAKVFPKNQGYKKKNYENKK
jgi:hypothetical protein